MTKPKLKIAHVIKPKAVTIEEYRKKILADFKKLWRYGHPMFYDLIVEMCLIHEVKNKSYGIGSHLGNFMECERFGIPAWKGCLVRLTDKVSRIYNLTTKMGDPEYADAFRMENFEDTLIDMANYSLLCLILFREAKKKRVFREILEPDAKSSEENCKQCAAN